MTMPDTLEGGCLCGAVRYRAIGTPVVVTLCHCRSCRLASGAPSVAWAVFRRADFAFVSGQPVEFSSSPGVVRAFCGSCGTPLSYRRLADTDTIDVTSATLDAADRFAPDKEIWLEERLSWTCLNEHIPHFARSSVGAAPIDVADAHDRTFSPP